MRCTLLRVRGYNRFDLGQIRELIITPESPIQLVLGTNGAGKSSLLALLLPTVPERADFDADGIYEYHCEHRGKTIRMKSQLTKGFKHEFYVDDSENLNVGGTGPAQWSLIEEYLETNDDFNRLMLGTETAYKFTEMPPMKRREWLTRICPVNVEYALQLFQIVKQQVRSLKAVNDHTLGKLLVARTDLEVYMAQSGTEKLQDVINAERKALEGMMGLPLFDSTTDSSSLLVMALNTKQFIKELITQITQYKGKSSKREKEIRDELAVALVKARGKLEAQTDELLNLENMIQQVNQAGAEDIEQVKAKAEKLKLELADLRVEAETIPADLNAETAYADFDNLQDTLTQLMLNWVDRENVFTQSEGKATFDRVEEMERKVRSARNRLDDIEQHIQHLEGAPTTECPQCSHIFTAGVQPGFTLPDYQKRLAAGKQWMEDNLPLFEAEKAKLERYKQWDADCRVLNDLARRHPSIKVFWDELFRFGREQGYGQRAIGLISMWYTKFERWDNYHEKALEITRLERMIKRFGSVDMQPMLERVNVLHKSREELLDTVESLVSEMTAVDERLETILDINAKLVQAEEMDEMMRHTGMEFVNYLFTKTVREAMALSIREISEAENKLNDVRSDIRMVAELEKTQQETEQALLYAQLVMEELNPSNGLIADTLAGPINSFVDYLNGIVDNIWEYDLRVMPCATDAQGLNYRFPLFSQKNDKPRKDIVQGSNGQKEVINQAFIIAAMHYKGFTDWPLLLDEFASTFDPQHQTNAMDFVRSLVDSQRVSQIWFISHYVINHSSFNTAQACVLDKTNIIVPEKYNEHVQLL